MCSCCSFYYISYVIEFDIIKFMVLILVILFIWCHMQLLLSSYSKTLLLFSTWLSVVAVGHIAFYAFAVFLTVFYILLLLVLLYMLFMLALHFMSRWFYHIYILLPLVLYCMHHLCLYHKISMTKASHIVLKGRENIYYSLIPDRINRSWSTIHPQSSQMWIF